MFAAIVLSVLNPLAASPSSPPPLDPAQVERRPYRDYVRECLDNLIAHGTDRYGPVKTPLLVAILDVNTRDCPEQPLVLDEPWRALRRGRRAPAGNNLYTDQATLRAMFRLSQMIGQPRYADFAHAYVRYVAEKLVDDKGFFWWGWHRHYDVYQDVMTGHNGNPHEIHVQEVAWPELWESAPAATRREVEALWQWHVIDKHTGEVNRHGDGHRGCDFAMSAGEILQAFAFLFARTGDRLWLDRARLVADYHHRARDSKTGLIPNRPNAGADRFDGSHFDTSITAYYCRGLLRAAEWAKEPDLGDRAVSYLKAYARYGFDEKQAAFWGSLRLDGTPVPGPRQPGGYAQYEPRGAIDLWQPYAAGYEHPHATAQVYAWAAQMTRDPQLALASRRWAEAIRRAWPPQQADGGAWYAGYTKTWLPHGVYAEQYGRTISFLLQMERLTGQRPYRDFAREVAREAVARLFVNGLFRGHPHKPYYESLDGVGYLLVALLQLDAVQSGVKDVPLENF